MPQRSGEGRVDQGDSAEYDVGLPAHSPEAALRFWQRLHADSDQPGDSSLACAGLMLGHFRVEEQIGRGGMGAVFRAVDTRLDREVALKVLAGTQSNDKSAVDRFQNEARAAARLDHENIARVFFVGEDHGLHFIAFEFIHGANVRQVIDSRGCLSPAEAVNYALQIAYALRHISDAGVVHRDVKPSNIIITPTGRAKLVDLGLARKVDPEASKDLTVDGTTLGTFDYISPEQAKDPRRVDIRSDVYSLGCTLYHMLTGEPPYPRGTMLQKLLDHQHKDVPDASSRNADVPPELSAVVKKMMASDPYDRYQSADELISDLTILARAYGLRPASTEGWVVPPRLSGWEFLRRHRAWIATAALLVVGVLLIDVVQSMVQGGASEESNLAAQSSPKSVPETDEPSFPTLSPQEAVARAGGDNVGVDWASGTGTELEIADIPAQSGHREDHSTELLPADVAAEDSGIVFDPVTSALSGITGGAAVPPFLSSEPAFLDAETPERNRSATGGSAAVPLPDPGNLLEDAGAEGSATTANIAASGETTKLSAFVVRADGESPQQFPTLEAACSAAPDGSVVELNFDGPSAEQQRPIRIIGKRLRLRRGPGRTPVIRFAVPEEWSSAQIVRMISVVRGSLEVYDVGLELEVDRDFLADSWVLLSLSQPEEVILRGVSVTLENPQRRTASIIEMAEPSTRSFDNRMPDAMERPAVRIDAEDSQFRGQADLFLCENVDPARVRLSNVAAALSGSLMHLRGMDAMDVLSDMNDEHRVELNLRHVTALCGDALIRFDVDAGKSVPRLAVNADNSVFVNSGNPVVSMSGEVDAFESRQLLEWSGGHSFIESQDPVWQISGPYDQSDYDLGEWNDLWRNGRLERFSGTNLLPRDRSIPYHQMTGTDLQLVDGGASPNPARFGASDGTDAGVRWDSPRLPVFAD